MIQGKTFGNAMTRKETFDEYYTRKLESLARELKVCIKGDIPYATSEIYACGMCQYRLKVHCQGHIHCLGCDVPASWSKELKACVASILERYPRLEESRGEWENTSKAKSPDPDEGRAKIAKQGDIVLVTRIREARIAKGWTREYLASKILKPFFQGNIATSTIQAYENGNARASRYVLEQIERVLELKGLQDE